MRKRAPDSWSSVPKSVRNQLRRQIFARDAYECQIRGPNCNGRAEDLDHIVPRDEDPTRVLDPSNLRAACIPCNRGEKRRSRTAPPSRKW